MEEKQFINYAKSTLKDVVVHHVGNPKEDQCLFLSQGSLADRDENLTMLLQKFFLSGFKTPEYYNFTFSNGDLSLNPVCSFAKAIFKSPDELYESSCSIAKHLFSVTEHPNIKAGDLFVVWFPMLFIEDQVHEAVGIFKSENKHSFLKTIVEQYEIMVNSDEGSNIDKLDKGALILNTDEEDGYRVLILDKSNQSIEAKYWRDDFLRLEPCADEFYQTREFMTLTKNYVAKQMTGEFEVSRADQIDLLNRSMDYFKKHETFDQDEFEENVLQQPEVIQSFQNYDKAYREENDLDPLQDFAISEHAVKKQSRGYKSVLKLDKNFHIYIHGNRDMIEQGVDANGRKYYKIFYEEET
jgi:hypothetical protein